MTQNVQLTVFFDGNCPLCRREIDHLKKHNQGALDFIDIHQPNALAPFPMITQEKAMARLHAMDKTGRVITGLDANVQAWALIGQGWKVRWLRWPLLRRCADLGYRWFARHRHTISRWVVKLTDSNSAKPQSLNDESTTCTTCRIDPVTTHPSQKHPSQKHRDSD